jgi:outer membrane protein
MLALCAVPALAGDVKVGFVDIERILRESAPAVKAAQKIEKEFAPRDEAIKKLGAQVRDIQDFLEKKGSGLSNVERRNKERELSNLSAELQREQREFREDLNQRKNEEYSVLLEHANKIIQSIAVSEHYDLVLQEAAYRNPRIDITDKVLKALNSD